ncbi:MAG: hypothetical protein AYL32_002020 [Candidatus Bathyarchaeota archaeon B26-2]|nr:MAG: hypothetical protein AYL32_002020 [Candidatus Bathyarchaeota archaeon B26-2]
MRVFVTDCEGPISKNDNAFELASYYIPRGDRFFTVVSRYDDVLADIVRRPGYKAGDTLRLILPFLRAYGASDKGMRRYSRENILLVPGAAETLRFVSETMPSFIVSTSYEHYISALCEVVGFPFENTYCTRLEIDRYKLSGDEIERLKEIAGEIAEMPMIEVPDSAESLDELSERDRETIKRLDEIFWNEISRMSSGRMLKEVNPVGGYEKANAVRDIASKMEVDFSDIIYIGDSITDVEPFRLVRERGGLTVSFNGNAYAIREAEIAVLSHHTVVTSILADAFDKLGKEGVIKLVEDWNLPSLRRICNPDLIDRLEKLYHQKPPMVELITSANRERLMRESSAFRKTVRGEAIGRLG